MYVRVFDKPNDRYYKSIVYCKLKQEYFDQFIVLNPYENSFELVDQIDRSTEKYKPIIEYIQHDTDDWIAYENEELLNWKRNCELYGKSVKLEFLWGYRDVCDNFEFICEVLEKKRVALENSNINIRKLTEADEWQYILTQEDADDFMKLFVGFHDSTLDKLVFEEETYMSKAIATFDNSEWYGIVEICFERVLAINIRPAEEGYINYIYDATLIVKDETVFWADNYMESEEELTNEDTYIKALSMKWRKIG